MKSIKRTIDGPFGKDTYPGDPRNPSGPFFVRDNPWAEYERLKQTLPPMEPAQYEEAIRQICQSLDL
jgi:hypothetical protein